MTGAVAALADRIAALPPGRRLVALAGPPGAGKSHVAEALAAAVPRAAVLPMDGFHYDDAVLTVLGRRARKGAPDTFDVAGLAHLLHRLRAGGDGAAEAVAVPVFDRALELSRGAARLIGPEIAVVIVEGNYLLLRDGPWAALAPLFDLTVMLSVPEAVLRARLAARWQGYGIAPDEIGRRVEGNDLPNGRRVMAGSAPADVVLANG